jgi:hypothetical protein
VLREGSELSRNLRELSASMRANAERILRDVRLAHGGMTARLDQAAPAGGAREPRGARDQRARRGEDGPDEDLDVPEFVPPS